jgi:hypothetical protein
VGVIVGVDCFLGRRFRDAVGPPWSVAGGLLHNPSIGEGRTEKQLRPSFTPRAEIASRLAVSS